MIQKSLKLLQSPFSFQYGNLGLQKELHIIGASVSQGQPIKGVQLGPDAIRNAGLIQCALNNKWKINDYGNISHNSLDSQPSSSVTTQNQERYQHVINADIMGQLNEKIFQKASEAASKKGFVLTLGGDHGVATGSISGVQSVYDNLQVIWVDAHFDITDPTNSTYPNYHSMPVSHLMGVIPPQALARFDWLVPKLKPENIVYIGTRLFDQDEPVTLKKHNILFFTPYEITQYGIAKVMEMTMDRLDPQNSNFPIHLSFDIDGMDPTIAKATGTKKRGGLNYREGLFLVKYLAESGNLVSMDLTQVNPLLEKDDPPRENYNADNPHIKGKQTECLAVELIMEAIGQ